MYNDLLCIADTKQHVVLLLLDLSAAFDTIDPDKLLEILREELDIDGIALKWFHSFLTGGLSMNYYHW